MYNLVKGTCGTWDSTMSSCFIQAFNVVLVGIGSEWRGSIQIRLMLIRLHRSTKG